MTINLPLSTALCIVGAFLAMNFRFKEELRNGESKKEVKSDEEINDFGGIKIKNKNELLYRLTIKKQ